MKKEFEYIPTRFMLEDSYYDEEMANFAVTFIEQLCHTKGTWAGKKFKLLDWQEEIIRDLFGTLKPNGYRQFNTAYIEIPKKNGKSELAAAVALLLCCGDGEQRAEIYGCAADRGQATIVFDVAADISRFARNTIDCLKYVRQLKEKNIAIIFEKENINTLEASGELLLTIMASLAQQESASLSQNVKLGLQFRYQEGKVQINHEHFLGYTKDEDGNLIICEEEAEIVRRIYREYLEGASFRDIAEGLERDKIKTGGKRYKWHLSTVQGILRNEKYIGDALLQKTITTDFIEKVRIKNDGTVPQYYVKGSQEAIIKKDVYTAVQEEMVRRANLTSGIGGKKKRIYSSKYALSSICTCTKCGDIYRRIAWNNRGKKSTVWRCCTRVENGPKACDAPTVAEEELQRATVKAINQLVYCPASTIQILKENIETALADEIDILRDKKQELLVKRAETEGVKKKVAELEDFLQEAPQELTEYDELMVRKYIDQIKIYEDHFTVCFKAKVEIDIQR